MPLRWPSRPARAESQSQQVASRPNSFSHFYAHAQDSMPLDPNFRVVLKATPGSANQFTMAVDYQPSSRLTTQSCEHNLRAQLECRSVARRAAFLRPRGGNGLTLRNGAALPHDQRSGIPTSSAELSIHLFHTVTVNNERGHCRVLIECHQTRSTLASRSAVCMPQWRDRS